MLNDPCFLMVRGIRAVGALRERLGLGWREEPEEFFRPTNQNPSRTI